MRMSPVTTGTDKAVARGCPSSLPFRTLSAPLSTRFYPLFTIWTFPLINHHRYLSPLTPPHVLLPQSLKQLSFPPSIPATPTRQPITMAASPSTVLPSRGPLTLPSLPYSTSYVSSLARYSEESILYWDWEAIFVVL